MDIDDFLKRKQFQVLDEVLTREMNWTAGDDLVSQMNSTFENPEIARDWYFSFNTALGGKRPYDVCKDGKQELVRTILMHIDYGIYS